MRDPRTDPQPGDILHRKPYWSCGYLMKFVPCTVMARCGLLVGYMRYDSPNVLWTPLDKWLEEYRDADLVEQATEPPSEMAELRAQVAQLGEVQGHLARLASERYDRILELERVLASQGRVG